MEFEELLKKRRSVRSFKSKEVSREALERILELANSSPSAGNLQARNVVIVREKGVKKRLSQACLNQDFVSQAPVVFVICANLEKSALKYGKRGRELYGFQDATIFTSYLQLAITNEGLDSCWVGAFKEEEVRNILGLEGQLRPVAIVPTGFRKKSPSKTPRKSLDELVKKRL